MACTLVVALFVFVCRVAFVFVAFVFVCICFVFVYGLNVLLFCSTRKCCFKKSVVSLPEAMCWVEGSDVFLRESACAGPAYFR